MREPRDLWRARLAAEKAKPCSVEGCGKPRSCKGLCSGHYKGLWLDAHPERRDRYNAQQKARQSSPEGRLKKRDRLYGPVFTLLWGRQQGLCAVCREPMLAEGRAADSVCVDHRHTPPYDARGLLHMRCNQALGLLRENLRDVAGLARYIQETTLPEMRT